MSGVTHVGFFLKVGSEIIPLSLRRDQVVWGMDTMMCLMKTNSRHRRLRIPREKEDEDYKSTRLGNKMDLFLELKALEIYSPISGTVINPIHNAERIIIMGCPKHRMRDGGREKWRNVQVAGEGGLRG